LKTKVNVPTVSKKAKNFLTSFFGISKTKEEKSQDPAPDLDPDPYQTVMHTERWMQLKVLVHVLGFYLICIVLNIESYSWTDFLFCPSLKLAFYYWNLFLSDETQTIRFTCDYL
jgi:hypothetical protein